MAQNWAVVIGINEYEHLSRPLKYAKRDAELMNNFLCNEAGFDKVYHFSENSSDRKWLPTRSNVWRFLQGKFEKPFMSAGDNFWFFFSGHGIRRNGCDYLMPADGFLEDSENSNISVNYIMQRLRRCGADNIVLILDACRDEGKSVEGIGNQTAAQARQMGVISLFSCSPTEISYEIKELQQGSFTHALLEGLRTQEKCATVEKLNQYLTRRVPELNRQYKKPNQTPFTIVEPIEKSHLILLPKYAIMADIATDIAMLKIDAYKVEVNKNLELAKQLWIRVLAASYGHDMEAVEAIGRIAIEQKPQGSIPDRSSSKERPKTEKSPQHTPNNSTPIESDIPLKSECGVDYTKLCDLLATEKWQEADEETAKKMLELVGRTNEGWLRVEDITLFPCADLRTIDQLWVKYSNGRFGFSVQKRIYESLGGTREYDENIWEAFCDRVDWRVNDNYLYYKDRKLNKSAPPGHLPWGWIGMMGWVDFNGWCGFPRGVCLVVSSLASRLVKCNI